MNATTPSNPRKRPAPGSSPFGMPANNQQIPQSSHQAGLDFSGLNDTSQLSDDQFLAWGQELQNTGVNAYDTAPGAADDLSLLQTPVRDNHKNTPSTQLVRRNQQQQLTTRGRSFTPGANGDMWSDGTVRNQWPQESQEDDAELERRAAEAKREAQSKRPPKQIPPFIQKLSSFLDNSNTELIKWSDSGTSFVVLDEDEFAKTLIPELFKHNNYASFVRQLNMYGFHKKVGLSDNSMRASEKKAKSPSEYYNAYFRRGRPELLWLIQKPKNEAPTSKRKSGKKSDDEETEEKPTTKQANNNTEIIQLPKQQWQVYQQEIEGLKRSQNQITNIISRLQQDNAQFIRQASAQQERHENSINAILTFLATFYHRNNNESGQSNLFSSIPNQPPQGTVFDMGDYDDNQRPDSTDPVQRNMQVPRRQPLAIQAPPSWIPGQDASNEPSRSASVNRQASISRPSSVASPANKFRNSLPRPSSRSSESPFARDKTATPNATNRQGRASANSLRPPSKQEQATTPPVSNEDVLSAINNANASSDINTHDLDFSSALRNYENANGNTPLTPEQRQNMINMLAQNSGTSDPSALVSQTPKPFEPEDLFGLNDNSFQSSLDQYQNNEVAISELKRLQAEQDSKVANLASRVQPLSPSGSIPGLESVANNPGQFDINSFFDDDAYHGDFDDSNDYFDLNGDHSKSAFGDGFNFDGNDTGENGMFQEAENNPTPNGNEGSVAGKVLGSIESESSGPPSPSVQDEVDEGAGRNLPNKRRRLD